MTTNKRTNHSPLGGADMDTKYTTATQIHLREIQTQRYIDTETGWADTQSPDTHSPTQYRQDNDRTPSPWREMPTSRTRNNNAKIVHKKPRN